MPAATLRQEYQAALGRRSDIQGHLPFLHSQVAFRPGAVVIELGVRTGVSTRALLEGARVAHGDVWSCDIAAPDVPDVIRSSSRWHFTMAGDLSAGAQEFLPAECDVLFNDAHDDGWSPEQLREHVLASLRAYVPRVRPGGVVLLHDTQWEPPATDLGQPVGGVAQALDAYCAEAGLSWRNRPGWYGLGVVRVRREQ